ncbi:MAG: chromosomal replication initiator protein DnaA [Elusimicrobiaceae bacterium]|nr:chromosomal replication initiator protein DnaA [Elusimicrobiaceae bacterium]
MKTLWPAIMAELEKELGADVCEMWLSPVKPLIFENGILTLEIPDQLWFQTIRTRYEAKIAGLLCSMSGLPACRIEYTIPLRTERAEPSEEDFPAAPVSGAAMQDSDKPRPRIFSNRLNQNYTFDKFIEGTSNRFAHKAAQAVVKKLGDRTNNPLVIYSTPGLGKTHLLHAIGNELIKTSANKKVLYISGEGFVSEYIESIQKKTPNAFRNKYRGLDCFLVDDIQFVAGKDASEREFFNTFNALYESKKQIVLTSDKTPTELGLEERLSSRLLSGIVAEIKVPDLETRIAILRAKREQENFNIPDDVLLFIAERIKSSIRELEGCLYRLSSYCSIHEIVPTKDVAKELLSDIISPEDEFISININSIKRVVGKHYNVDIKDFKAKKKSHAVAWPRQIAMYLANELTDMSLNDIGIEFERDHATVVHARDKVKKELDESPFFSAEMNQIINEIKSVDKQ